MSVSESTIEGHLDTLRKVEVECGETKRADLTEITPPLSLQQGQVIKDAVSSLQQTSNLKFGEVVPHGVRGSNAILSYRLEGLDKPVNGICSDKGLGIILIAFILTQPRSMPVPPGFQVITSEDRSLAILSRPDAVKILDSAKIESIDKPFSERIWAVEPSSRELALAPAYAVTR
jgi:hypothetical protein